MFFHYCLAVLFFTIAIKASHKELGLPNGWSACSEDSPNYKECLKKAIQTAIRSLKNGNKQLGVPPIDPLVTNKFVYENCGKLIKCIFLYDNYVFTGLSDVVVKDVENNWERLSMKLFFKHVEMDGMLVSINGTFIERPMWGTRCPIHYYWDNLILTVNIKFSEVEKCGKTYFHVDNMECIMDPGYGYYNYKNLYNGDVERENSMNKFIEENWKIMTHDMIPAVNGSFGSGFGNIANLIFSKIPSCVFRNF